MSTSPASLLVLVNKDFVCVKVCGRANFLSSPDFKALLAGLTQKGYGRFIMDLSECLLMDSTFLGVLAGCGLKMCQADGPTRPGIELSNPNPRITELLENLGALGLFKVTTGPLPLADCAPACIADSVNPSREEITRTSLEAHQTLMAMNPDNVGRFKDVAQFLAEDLQNLEKGKPD